MPCVTVSVTSETKPTQPTQINWLMVGAIVLIAGGVILYLRR